MKHVFWPVQPLVFIANLDQIWKQNSLLTVWNFLMTHCSLQLCLWLFCNQTRRFVYPSGKALYGECSYIEAEAVYVINIHGKTIQWELRKQLQYYKYQLVMLRWDNILDATAD